MHQSPSMDYEFLQEPHPLWFHSCLLHLAQCCPMNERKNAMIVPLFILALYPLHQAILWLWDDFTPSKKLTITIFSTRALKIIFKINFQHPQKQSWAQFYFKTNVNTSECQQTQGKTQKLRDRGLYDSYIFSGPWNCTFRNQIITMIF